MGVLESLATRQRRGRGRPRPGGFFVGDQPVNLFFCWPLTLFWRPRCVFLLTLGWLSHIFGTKWRFYGILMRFTVGFIGLNGISIGFDLMELLGQLLSMEYEWTIDGIYHLEIMNDCLQLGKSCTNGKLNESWIGWVDNGKAMENHHLENRLREYYICLGGPQANFKQGCIKQTWLAGTPRTSHGDCIIAGRIKLNGGFSASQVDYQKVVHN